MTVKEIDELIDRQIQLQTEYDEIELAQTNYSRNMKLYKECDRKMQVLSEQMERIRWKLAQEGIT